MAIESKSVEYAKEIDDVMVLFVEVVKNRKAKAALTDLIDELMTALAGIDQVDDEFIGNRKVALQTVGYRTGELTDAFLPVAAEPSAPAT